MERFPTAVGGNDDRRTESLEVIDTAIVSLARATCDLASQQARENRVCPWGLEVTLYTALHCVIMFEHEIAS